MEESEKDLYVRTHREELVSRIDSDPEEFRRRITHALDQDQPEAWRSAWLLGQCIKKNDLRMKDHITALVRAIKGKKDGHQREILKILDKMDIDTKEEGPLFDICLSIWESVNKNPSVRIIAFQTMAKIAGKYPELVNELEYFIQDEYLDTLSPGIRHTFNRTWEKLQKQTGNTAKSKS